MSATVAITAEECKAGLSVIVGAKNTSAANETISVAPADAAQISAILSFARGNGIAVTPHGSSTKSNWGYAVDAHIRLDLRRLNKLREHAWQDMTCTVEAGCTWAAMQTELARHGQMVALDPLWPEHATVGGVVAANDSGSLRLKYGGLRDLIIGMTVVLADGTMAKTGGKVVKNVAGYDLHKLLTGSFGTLGVIAQVNFRLHPLEINAKTWTATVTTPLEFAQSLRALLDSQLTPSSIQIRFGSGQCALDVRIAAPPECMAEHEAKLRSIFAVIALEPSTQDVWLARQRLHDTSDGVLLKISTLPGDLCRLLTELSDWAVKNDADAEMVAQATGVTTVKLLSAPDTAKAYIEQLRTRLKKFGGSVVALRVPNTLQGSINPWGYESNALPLMKEIKRRFDPNRILNPGRFVGNI
jgi:FAD/FMN-containing dehydrogenases